MTHNSHDDILIVGTGADGGTLACHVGKQIRIGGTAHQCGTYCFGHDPTTSALDVHCEALRVGDHHSDRPW